MRSHPIFPGKNVHAGRFFPHNTCPKTGSGDAFFHRLRPHKAADLPRQPRQAADPTGFGQNGCSCSLPSGLHVMDGVTLTRQKERIRAKTGERGKNKGGVRRSLTCASSLSAGRWPGTTGHRYRQKQPTGSDFLAGVARFARVNWLLRFALFVGQAPSLRRLGLRPATTTPGSSGRAFVDSRGILAHSGAC